MLPAAARLRRRAEFVATVRGGRRRGHGVVVVHLNLPDPAQSQKAPTPAERTARDPAPSAGPPARVGFVVSRAVGGAVPRNRVRRRLQHLVRERLHRIPPGATVVVRALPGAADRGYAELSADLDVALNGAIHGRGGRRRRTPAPGRSSTATNAPGQPEPRRAAPDDSDGGRPQPRSSAPARGLAAPIVAYRRWVSPVLPARCRFHPSCSAYALQALQTHGALRGLLLTVWRLLRCHPFHPGGYDPVPPAPRRRPRITVSGASR